MDNNWQILFYVDDKDYSPVEEFLTSLPEKDQAKLYYVINLLKNFGIKLREPHSKKIVNELNLFELRSKHSSNIQRVFYFYFTDNTFILLHGFTKKSQKIPKNELKTALDRKKDFIRRIKDG